MILTLLPSQSPLNRVSDFHSVCHDKWQDLQSCLNPL